MLIDEIDDPWLDDFIEKGYLDLFFKRLGESFVPGEQQALIRFLEVRFGNDLTQDDMLRVMGCKDYRLLRAWFYAAVHAESVGEVFEASTEPRPIDWDESWRWWHGCDLVPRSLAPNGLVLIRPGRDDRSQDHARVYQLKEFRRNAGLTQTQVATVMGVSRARVSQIEHGMDTSPETVRRYIGALNDALSE